MKWISHRGESADAPENTIEAYKLAMERDTDGMECDLHLTRDGKVVCSHDGNTGRMGDKDLVIKESTYEELLTVDVGAKKAPEYTGAKIPLWSEVAPLIKQGRAFFVELKSDAKGLLPGIREAFANQPADCGEIAFISFTPENIKVIRQEYPNLRGSLLLGCRVDENGNSSPTAEEVISQLKQCNATGVDIQGCREAIDAEYVQKVKDAGYEFHVWTIDLEENARYFMSIGVDSITSNCAARLKGILEAC